MVQIVIILIQYYSDFIFWHQWSLHLLSVTCLKHPSTMYEPTVNTQDLTRFVEIYTIFRSWRGWTCQCLTTLQHWDMFARLTHLTLSTTVMQMTRDSGKALSHHHQTHSTLYIAQPHTIPYRKYEREQLII